MIEKENLDGVMVETTTHARAWIACTAMAMGMDAYIAASGLITALPLICFNAAAKRLRLVTVGILQYIAPSLTLGLAVMYWGEPFDAVHRWTFGAVWLALAIFTLESIAHSRRQDA